MFFFLLIAPHIGHFYSACIADCVFRYEKLRSRSKKYLFSTGTDEHGTKIQQAAALHKQNPEQYCNQISQKYKNLFDDANVRYSHFNRTTDKVKHFPAVQHFWVCCDFSVLMNKLQSFVLNVFSYFSLNRINLKKKTLFIKPIMLVGIVFRMKRSSQKVSSKKTNEKKKFRLNQDIR